MFGAISQTFGRSFLTAHLLPAGFLCAAAVLAMKDGLLKREWADNWSVFGTDRALLLLVVIFVIAVLLNLFSKQITRLYEGYSKMFFVWYAGAAFASAFGTAYFTRQEFVLRWPIEWLLLLTAGAAVVLAGMHEAGQKFHRQGYMESTARIEDESQKHERPLRRYHFARNYPREEHYILATKFGNILRAFEHYPSYVFGMDPITMWFRLMAVVPDSYKTQLEIGEASTQFFLNLSVVSVLFAGGSIYVALRLKWLAAVGVALLLVASAYLMYRFACANARDWGEQVRAVFDLYRFDLLKQLSVHTPEPQPWSLDVERAIWTRVQQVTFYAKRTADIRYAPAEKKRRW